jgi:RNA polymerase sigma-70 factor (ECF subfamily)
MARSIGCEGEELNEAEAIRRARQGDEAAFEHLYRLHSRRVYVLCLRMAANRAEAEDLTQEAFLQVFRKIATFRGESAFSTWLHRLTVNIVLMRLRKKTPAVTSLENANDPDEESGQAHREVGGPDPLMVGLLDRVNLGRALQRLSEGYRKVFLLHDVQGYEHHEIAEILGCTAGNTKSQLHKARRRLRELLWETERGRAGQARGRAHSACSRPCSSPFGFTATSGC